MKMDDIIKWFWLCKLAAVKKISCRIDRFLVVEIINYYLPITLQSGTIKVNSYQGFEHDNVKECWPEQ